MNGGTPNKLACTCAASPNAVVMARNRQQVDKPAVFIDWQDDGEITGITWRERPTICVIAEQARFEMTTHDHGLPKGRARFGNVAVPKPSLSAFWSVGMIFKKCIDVDVRPPKGDGRVAIIKCHSNFSAYAATLDCDKMLTRLAHESRKAVCVPKPNEARRLRYGLTPRRRRPTIMGR
jgi:hypothetical protein